MVSIRASDPDGDDFTFVIENQLPARYFIVSSNGDVTVADGQRPDREVRSNLHVLFTACNCAYICYSNALGLSPSLSC